MLNIFLHAVFGLITGAFVWVICILIILGLITLKQGYVNLEMMGTGGNLPPLIPIILAAFLGIIQGIFIGIVTGYYKIDTIIQGAIAAFITTEFLLLLYYIISNLMNLFTARDFQQAIRWMDMENFITFSVLLFIPTVIIGLINAKAYLVIRSLN